MLAPLTDTQLYYAVEGEGPTLMLMHGGLGLDHTTFRPWLDPLAKSAELVFYDHRGNGRSASLESYDGITAGTMADDADALRRALGREKVSVFGHSVGAAVAIEYALRHPDRIAALVLCAPSANYFHIGAAFEKLIASSTGRAPEALQEALTNLPTDSATLLSLWCDVLPLYFKDMPKQLPDQWRERVHTNASAFLYTAAKIWPKLNLLPCLANVKAPTLVLAGVHDWGAPPDGSAGAVARGIPGAELVTFDSGHFPFIEQQASFNEIVAFWVAKHGG